MQRLDGGVKGGWPVFGWPSLNVGPSSPSIPWTLNDIPANYRSLWGDISKPILNAGKVAALPNRWSEGLILSQADPLYQLNHGMSKGFPALLFPDSANACGLTPTTNYAPVWWMFVADYPTATFNAPSFLLDGGSVNRVFGNTNGEGFLDSNSWASKSNLNGVGYADKLLPLSLSSLQVRGVAATAPWSLGRRGTTLQSWQGPIYHVMALVVEPTGDLLQRIEGRVHWDFGIQTKLPVGHPYRNSPPMKVAA